MTLPSFIIVLFIFILSGVIVLRPFLEQKQAKIPSKAGVYDSLLAERERLLSAIEELDLDLELSKISPGEHAQDRNLLLSQAADVLKELDRYSKPKKTKKATASVKDVGEDELEKMISERRMQLKEEKADLCSSCGDPISPDDQFCSHCGAKQ
jgi:hypothetical protein